MIPTILKNILDKKAKHPILKATRDTPLTPLNLDFPIIIAEIKTASPSAGNIGKIVNPKDFANSYLKGDSTAISILCEEEFFTGSFVYLHQFE